MKKFISIISIILAICLMASCGNVSETVTSGTDATINASTTETTADTAASTTDVTTAVENTSTAPVQTTQITVASTTKTATAKTEETTGSVASGCEISVTIEDYDEYVSFITSMGMPDSFMTYEELSFLGNFQTFICEPFTTGDECKEYIYVVEDDNGYSVMLSIELAEKELVTENYIFMSDNISDYRFVEYDNVVHSIVNDLKYSYARGKLFAITALFGNIKIVMTISGGRFENYPVNGEDTFMSKLLSADTAKGAAAELVASIQTAKK